MNCRICGTSKERFNERQMQSWSETRIVFTRWREGLDPNVEQGVVTLAVCGSCEPLVAQTLTVLMNAVQGTERSWPFRAWGDRKFWRR